MSPAKKNLHTIARTVEVYVSSSAFKFLIICWFLLQALFFVFFVKFGIPPDENHHLEHIKLLADNGLLPIVMSQEGYYILGEAIKTPFFLYHYLLSIPYALIQDLPNAYIYLRLINVGLGILSLLVVVLLAKEMKLSRFATNTVLLCLSSTLMFVFLFASINYDNLFILITLLSTLLLVKFYKSLDPKKLAALVLVAGLGLLTKITYLPILAVIITVVVWRLLKSRQDIRLSWAGIKTFIKANKLLLLILLIVLTFVSLRYVSNVASYGDIEPSCTSVHTIDQCRQNPVFSRNEAIDANRRTPSLVFSEYITKWSFYMRERTIGVFAHQTMHPNKILFTVLSSLLVIGALVTIRMWRTKDSIVSVLLYVFLAYTIVLFADSYSRYLEIGRPSFAVQGRYLFGVLPILYLIYAFYLDKILHNSQITRVVIALAIMGVFALSSLPSFMIKVGFTWS